MIQGNLLTNYFRYIISSIATQVIFTLYTMVDALFVARGVSATALAAVNIAAPYICICYAISITFGVGTSTVVAKLFGKGEFDKAKIVFSQSITFAIICSAVVTALSMLFTDELAFLLGATESTKADVITYIRWIAPFSVCFIVSYIFEILIATDGFPTRATLFVCVGVITNCILDYVFIFKFNWGVMGAAFATSLAQLTVTIPYLSHFLGKRGTIKFCRFKFNPRRLLDELYKGMPAGLNELAPGLLTLIFVQTIQRVISEDALISYSTASYITGIAIVIFYAAAQGCQPLISYFNGSGNKDNIRRLFKYEIITAAVIAVICVAGLELFAGPLVELFLYGESEALISYSTHTLRIMSLFCLLGGFNTVIIVHFSSMERPIPATVLSIFRYTLFVLIAIFALVKLFGGEAIWWALLLDEAMTLILGILLLKKSKILE